MKLGGGNPKCPTFVTNLFIHLLRNDLTCDKAVAKLSTLLKKFTHLTKISTNLASNVQLVKRLWLLVLQVNTTVFLIAKLVMDSTSAKEGKFALFFFQICLKL